MKSKTLKYVKISSLAVIASIALALPVTSMAHNTGHSQAYVLVNLPPLFSTYHVHDYGHNYRPHPQHKVTQHHHYNDRRYGNSRHAQVTQHHPKRVVRSYEGYSDNKIINKHFK